MNKMKININIVKSIGFSVIGISLLVGSIFVGTYFNKPVDASSSSSAVIQVQPNKMERKDWNLNVTNIEFSSTQGNPKWANVHITLNNANGADKKFIPKGSLIALVGTSGKVYNFDNKISFDTIYNNTEETRQSFAKKQGRTYKPGIMEIVPVLTVDSTEQNFTKIIYVDENNNQIEVPIQGITPEIIKPNPDAK